MLGRQVRRPLIRETTALGAAYLAGLAVGVWKDRAELSKLWHCDAAYVPLKDAAWRAEQFRGWNKAVGRSLRWAEEE